VRPTTRLEYANQALRLRLSKRSYVNTQFTGWSSKTVVNHLTTLLMEKLIVRSSALAHHDNIVVRYFSCSVQNQGSTVDPQEQVGIGQQLSSRSSQIRNRARFVDGQSNCQSLIVH
jgi:hypothetical protein